MLHSQCTLERFLRMPENYPSLAPSSFTNPDPQLPPIVSRTGQALDEDLIESQRCSVCFQINSNTAMVCLDRCEALTCFECLRGMSDNRFFMPLDVSPPAPGTRLPHVMFVGVGCPICRSTTGVQTAGSFRARVIDNLFSKCMHCGVFAHASQIERHHNDNCQARVVICRTDKDGLPTDKYVFQGPLGCEMLKEKVARDEPDAKIIYEGSPGNEKPVKKEYGHMYQDLNERGQPTQNNYVNEANEVWAIAKWGYRNFVGVYELGRQVLTGAQPRGGMGGPAGGSNDPPPAAPAKWYSDPTLIEQAANELRNIMLDIQEKKEAGAPGFVPVQDPKAESLRLVHQGIVGGKFNMTAFIKYYTPDYTKLTFATKYVGEDKYHIYAMFDNPQWLKITGPNLIDRFFGTIANNITFAAMQE